MNKPYHILLEEKLDHIKHHLKEGGIKPSLLLHACCGPCSSYVLEYLLSYFSITVYFYNPNIHPAAEYNRRQTELENFVKEFRAQNEVQGLSLVCEQGYNPEEYFTATGTKENNDLQVEREKGERCRRCYEFRMKKAFEYAAQNSFDYVTTTLSISPHKDAEKINTIGETLGKLVENPKYLFADFKKKSGFKRSLELSDEYGLYRQDYCGCVYSMRTPQILEKAFYNLILTSPV
ncbi:MAG TPA: epoxyqueuosine reductase QueH [Treponemataceae bacterium]|nr:epoxyqueuosine reductase QueH [Treponemataceae bacterium]